MRKRKIVYVRVRCLCRERGSERRGGEREKENLCV